MSSLLILCSFIFCFVFSENAENPVDVTSVDCRETSGRLSESDSYAFYDYSISWVSNPGDKLFFAQIDPSCLSAANWCKGKCAVMYSLDVTGKRSLTQTYKASSAELRNGFNR